MAALNPTSLSLAFSFSIKVGMFEIVPGIISWNATVSLVEKGLSLIITWKAGGKRIT